MKQRTGTKSSRGAKPLTWLRAIDRKVSSLASSRRARRLMFLALICLTLTILAWSVYSDWDRLSSFEWRFDLRYLGVSFLCYSVGLSMWLLNWHGIVRRLAGITSFRLNVKIYLYSTAARRLPGFVWYLGSLLYLYRQEGVPRAVTSASLLLEAALMTLAGLLVFLASIPFSQLDLLEVSSPWYYLAMLPLLVVAFQPSLLIRLLNAVLSRRGSSPLELQIGRQDSIRWTAQYAAGSVFAGLTLYYLTWAIHPLPMSALPGVIGIVALIPALRLIIFFIPGGWGLQEVSLSLSLIPHLPLPVALGIPLLFRLWLITSELVWLVACSLIL